MALRPLPLRDSAHWKNNNNFNLEDGNLIHVNPLPKNRKKFGLFLRNARKRARFSQEEVAKELNLKSSQSLSNIECGKCGPSLRVAICLADKYKIDVEKMIDYLLKLEKSNLRFRFGLIKTVKNEMAENDL